MLDLGSIKAGKFVPQHGSFNIREVIKKVMEIQKYEAKLKGL